MEIEAQYRRGAFYVDPSFDIYLIGDISIASMP
jgi:hypothetical protein